MTTRKVKRKEIIRDVEEEYCDGCGKYLGEKYRTTDAVYCGDCNRTYCSDCYGDQKNYVDDNAILHIPCNNCRDVLKKNPAILEHLVQLDKEEELINDERHGFWSEIKRQSILIHPTAKPQVSK